MIVGNVDSLSCIAADSETNRQIDLSELVTEVEWEESLLDQPGRLTITYLEEGLDQQFQEGSNVVLAVNGQRVFDGYVFTRQRTHGATGKITVYDRIRYLGNKDTRVFTGQPVTDIFSQLCSDLQLPFKVSNGSSYRTSPVVHDNKSLYSMIIRAIDETLINTGQYLMVRDDIGALDLVDIATLTTDVLIGDGSLLTGFDFQSSIDSQTYNYIKLIQENKTSQMREVYIAMDSSTIGKWGQLQYFDKMDSEANASQIIERANQLLQLYNRKTKSLRLTALGSLKVRAGSGVGLAISKLRDDGVPYNQMVFVSRVKHRISKGVHTMDLTVEVV